MIRAVLIVVIALFAVSFTPLSHADGDDGDIVVWGN